MSEAEEHRIMQAMKLMRSENREDFQKLFDKFEELYKHGCVFAETHKQLEPRMQKLELADAKREGRAALAVLLISACSSFIMNKISKLF